MARWATVVVLSGLLWAGKAHEQAYARSHSSAPNLTVDSRRILATADGSLGVRIERRTVSLAGLPVRHAYEVLETASQGPQVVAARLPSSSPQFEPEQAEVSAGEVAAAVAAELGLDHEVQFERSPQLVYVLILGAPVLAWEVQLPFSTQPVPSRKTLWVSAMTGRLLEERERVRSSRARVFAQNPAKTPEPIDVELTGLDAKGAGQPLRGERVISMNCVSDPPGSLEPWHDEGDCYAAHVMMSDDRGDFLPPLPAIIDPAQSVQPQDAYAELSMYYHAERFLDVVQSKGIEGFRCDTSLMLANFRQLEPSGGSPPIPYSPVNNAFWTGQCDPERGPTMIFGQGTDVDFGYDGDVVYHELGHGMVAHLTPDGLGGRTLRSDAVLVDAGALNEAVADYFSYLMTDDPQVGEYVGRFWNATSRPFVRTGENTKTCPASTVGQVHNDGEPFAAALWATRRQIGPILDQIVLTALTRLPADADLELGATTLLEVGQTLIEMGRLEPEEFDILHRSIEQRGLLDCSRVISEPSAVANGRTVYLRRRTRGVSPFSPGPMQLRYEVPAGATRAEISFEADEDVQADEIAVLVKFADEPLTYSYTLTAADEVSDASGQRSNVREVIGVRGDWDVLSHAERTGPESFRLVLDGLDLGMVLHVGLASTRNDEVVVSSFAVRGPGSDSDEASGTGGVADTEDFESVAADNAVAGSCGCTAPGGRLTWAWVALVLGSVRRRRWRH